MPRSIRAKRRLPLAREFRNSVKAGPRVWLIVALAFLCLLGLPLLSHLASLLATIAVGIGLLFVAPVIVSVVVAALLARFKKAVIFRVATDGMRPGTSPQATTSPLPGDGTMPRADVIQVTTLPAEKGTPVLGR